MRPLSPSRSPSLAPSRSLELTSAHTHSVPAFINYNLTGQGLAHCISVAAPKLVLFESDLAPAIADVSPSLDRSTKLVRWVDAFSKSAGGGGEKGGVEGEQVLDEAVLAQMSTERIPDERRKGIKWSSPCCLIYTSGCVGLSSPCLLRAAELLRAASTLYGFRTGAAPDPDFPHAAQPVCPRPPSRSTVAVQLPSRCAQAVLSMPSPLSS